MLFHKPAIHAIYVLCYLSRQKLGAVCSASVIAESMQVPPEQAAKVLQILHGCGYVAAERGRAGGYRLALGLEDISVLDVIDALATGAEEDCLHERECPITTGRPCSAHNGMVELNERVRQSLASITLADMLGTPCNMHAPPLVTLKVG